MTLPAATASPLRPPLGPSRGPLCGLGGALGVRADGPNFDEEHDEHDQGQQALADGVLTDDERRALASGLRQLAARADQAAKDLCAVGER